jgi:hypothetical protein
MLCRPSVMSGALLCSLVGCFNPDGGATPDTDAGTDSEEPSTTGPSTTNEPTTTSISATEPTTPTTMPPEESSGTGPGVVCGDGNVEGDEVCDDGVNDGTYGSCSEDCSAFGPRCGDSEINGGEECDDGTNDNSYGGCSEDCSAFGPFCGDGVRQNAQEMCDNGDANANGSGCNVDCVTSGTLLFEYEVPLGTTCFSYSEPVTRDDGNVLFAFSDNCDQTWTFAELSPELEEVESTQALLSSYPYRAIMRGTDWILGAYNCNVLVTEAGIVSEICGDPRIAGGDALVAIDDELYIAMQNNTVAQWGADSPAGGDAPDWSATAPANTTNYFYYYYTGTPGALGSVTAAGYYRYYNGTENFYYGYVQRYNSAGNPLNSNSYTELEYIYEIHDSPSGALIARGSGDEGNDVMRLNANLNVTWAVLGCPPDGNGSDMVVDSAGHIVLDCGGEYPARYLRKLDDDGNELWSTDIESDYDPTGGSLTFDADDNIIRLAYLYDSLVPEYRLRIEKYAP